MNNHKPIFKPFQIDLNLLCNNNMDQPFLVECYDWDGEREIAEKRREEKRREEKRREEKRIEEIMIPKSSYFFVL